MDNQGGIVPTSELQVLFARIPADRLALLDSYSEIVTDPGEDEVASTFDEPVPAFEFSRNKALVVLIVNNTGQVTRVAIGKRGYSAGTGLSQVQISHLRKITHISAASFSEEVERRYSSRVREVSQRMGLLTPGASKALLKLLRQKSPEILEMLQAAHASALNPISALSTQQQIRLQQESDAALTAMLIAGIDRDNFLIAQTDSSPETNWFLKMVTEPRLREDPMITNDLHQFPGFKSYDNHVSGAVRFQHKDVVLTVILINRQPLEEVTGTDLIYYNETFGSFIMVQYKAMELEGNEHVFRLPNANLDKEIHRMKEFQAQLGTIPGSAASQQSYRLNSGPFFLKFCPRHVPNLACRELVPGIYFSLDHWGLVEMDDRLRGPNEGRALRLQSATHSSNAGRYLTNTDFALLVGKAWVGTTIEQSVVLEKMIQQTLQSGRSVTLAREPHGLKV